MKARLVLFAFLFSLAPLSFADTGHDHKEGDPTKLGKVHFPISCGAESQKKFDVALAMLHSFWYGKSDKAFADLAASDPGCAMAHWGVALSRFHQIWEVPPADDLKAGVAAMAAARAAGAKTQRERDYIEALGAYYDKSDSLDHVTRFLAYEKSMGELAAKYPKDPERDAKHAASIAELYRRYEERLEQRRKAGAADPQLEEFRWHLEELRVSLFAQELRTPYPVSVKRLQKLWGALAF